MSNGFVHSIPVPRLYKTAAKTVRQVTEEGASLKQLIYEKKHPNLKGVYALATNTLQNAAKLNEIIRKTQLLFKEPRFDPWLARVLITELLWGKGNINNDSKPIQTILSYENEIREHSENTSLPTENESKKKVQKPRYIRVNTLVKSVEEVIELFKEDEYELLPAVNSYKEFLESLSNLSNWPFPVFVQDFHVKELFAFPHGTQFYDHPGYQSGAIVLQDKASCLPAYLLNPSPCSVVLDMCAAPGMKTTHLAAILQNKGKIFSVERNERRYNVLCEMVNNANATCVETMNADALTLNSETCPDVEYILVDPSCSGSGMDRPDFEDSQGKCAPGRLKRLQSFQVLLLRHALLNFPAVKRVIYSTCSMYPEENEMVVDEILGDIGEAYKLVPINSLLNDQWMNYSSTEFKCKDNCLYARPEIDCSNGFFVAVFERNAGVPLPQQTKRSLKSHRNHNTEELVKENEVDINRRDKKCKKKRKSKRDSEAGDQEHLQVIEDPDVSSKDEVNGRNKGSEWEEAGERTENDVSEKKRKKKHKKDREEKINSVQLKSPTDFHINEVEKSTENLGTTDETKRLKEKKKKKKRRHEEESVECDHTDAQINVPEEAIQDSPKVKKKKKKSKHFDD